MNETDDIQELLRAEVIGLDKDPVLKKMWGFLYGKNLNMKAGVVHVAMLAINARIAILQQEIIERNEASSKRMECTSYIMLVVALAALIVSIISVIK